MWISWEIVYCSVCITIFCVCVCSRRSWYFWLIYALCCKADPGDRHLFSFLQRPLDVLNKDAYIPSKTRTKTVWSSQSVGTEMVGYMLVIQGSFYVLFITTKYIQIPISTILDVFPFMQFFGWILMPWKVIAHDNCLIHSITVKQKHFVFHFVKCFKDVSPVLVFAILPERQFPEIFIGTWLLLWRRENDTF